jgi:hypothetical protein
VVLGRVLRPPDDGPDFPWHLAGARGTDPRSRPRTASNLRNSSGRAHPRPRIPGQRMGIPEKSGLAPACVHPDGLEVTIGAFDGLVSGNTMPIEGASMRQVRPSVWPIVAGNRECIRLWVAMGPAHVNGRCRPGALPSMKCGPSWLLLASLQLTSFSPPVDDLASIHRIPSPEQLF